MTLLGQVFDVGLPCSPTVTPVVTIFLHCEQYGMHIHWIHVWHMPCVIVPLTAVLALCRWPVSVSSVVSASGTKTGHMLLQR